MKKTIGILAHVDAGKTTFSEQLLFHTKSIREIGRVDRQTSHLDLHAIEQQRGITVFADEAVFQYENNEYTLIDTPGHIDFSAEMERSLLALDGAILLIDGTDGVQGHTDTIWQLLQRHNIPTMIFINKMDQSHIPLQEAITDIQEKLSSSALLLHDWTSSVEEFSMLNEQLMDDYLAEKKDNKQWQEQMTAYFMRREFFPIIAGSALKGEGINWALTAFDRLLQPKIEEEALKAVIYKIRHIEQNQIAAFTKIKSGVVKNRQPITLAGETFKISQLRKYNGEKYIDLQEAVAGDTVAIIGLKNAQIGMYLNEEEARYNPILIPTMRAKVVFENTLHPKELLSTFRLLEREDPALDVEWLEQTQEINLKIMGEIQLEIVSQLFEDRFNEKISFEDPTIIYKETIQNTVCGFGHFEPLKHYAEVHLEISPAQRGQGIQTTSTCHANDLTQGYQNLIQQHLTEKPHRGILTGGEITDLNITLMTGRAHQKHTEGGDFREATLRALRQGLEQANNELLEPYYAFTLKAELALLGKMMTDLKQMHATIDEPKLSGALAIVTGYAPVATIRNYPQQFAAYTNGRGSMQLQFSGYDHCHNSEEVIAALQYDKDADAQYSSNSIFCAKGKGYKVPWQEAQAAMHCPIK